MLAGDWASDMALGAARNRERSVENRAREAEDWNAKNLAIRFALAEQLSKLDPDNPLLANVLLLERLKNSGQVAFDISGRDYDAAREAGRTFSIPERANTKHSTKEAAENIVFRAALAKELERLDPENPLLKDATVKARLSNLARLTFDVSKGNFDAVRDVASGFEAVPGAKPAKPAARMQPPQLMIDQEKMNLTHAGAIAVRNALMQQLRIADPENPLVKDVMMIERLKKHGEAAFKIGGDNFQAARDAGNTFRVPERDAVVPAPITPANNESTSQQVSTLSDNSPTVKSKRWFR
jgi:hypothetical protein